VSLIEQDGTTLLRYTVEFNVHGKLAQIGARLMMSTLQKLSRDFFAKFSARFEQNPSLSVDSGAR